VAGQRRRPVRDRPDDHHRRRLDRPLGRTEDGKHELADLERRRRRLTEHFRLADEAVDLLQSANLTLSPAQATFTTTQATTTPVHVGDICNLGIFCLAPTSNRNLLDFNSETIDPTTGCAHIAFADDNTVNMLRVANQTTGCIRSS
jgi:hypothetical protein